MSSYCGKLCDECIRKEEMNCRGCKSLYGSCAPECDIADCCRRKFHETCETCSSNSVCSKLKSRFTVPDVIKSKRERDLAEKEKLKKNAEILGKWLWLMFWLIIPNIISAFLEMEFMGKMLNSIGVMIAAVCIILYGLFMLKLSVVNDDYKTAAILTIITGLINGANSIIGIFVDIDNFEFIFTIPAAILSLIGAYTEYKTHADVLYRVDAELSEKWNKLWKLYWISIAAVIGGAVLVIFGLLGLLIVLAGLVLTVVVSIKQLNYLYNTAKVFKEFR